MKKLNIGCGAEYKEGWVNMDWNENIKTDILHDIRDAPYPFKKNTFDVVLLKHVLEHIKDVNPMMEELWRITKPYRINKAYGRLYEEGIIEIRVPHWSHYNAWVNIEHQRAYTIKTFDAYENKGYYSSFAHFKIRKKEYCFTTYDKKSRLILNKIMNPMLNALPHGFVETLLCKFLPIYEVRFEFEVVK